MFFEASKNGWLGVALAAAVLASCSAGPAPSSSGRPRVVCTTTIVADLVREVAGDRVEIDCLMAAGIDPHSYRATPRDADRLAAADLVVASGLRLEGKLADLLDRLAARMPVLAVAERLPRDRLLDAGAGLSDPHVWFDPALWARCAEPVADALGRLDPPHAAAYRDRARAYAARLEALDETIRRRIETLPAARRTLVTAHDAFRYFGRAYGIEVVGVQGTSTESEAGLADVNGLVDLLVERRIPAVFVETSVSDRSVRALVEGAAARGHAVRLGGRLYSDSLGEPGSGGESLVAALAANVETIVAALAAPSKATVPAAGRAPPVPIQAPGASRGTPRFATSRLPCRTVSPPIQAPGASRGTPRFATSRLPCRTVSPNSPESPGSRPGLV